MKYLSPAQRSQGFGEALIGILIDIRSIHLPDFFIFIVIYKTNVKAESNSS